MNWLLYGISLTKQLQPTSYFTRRFRALQWKRVKSLAVESLVLGDHQAPSYMNEVASHSI